MWLSDTFAVNSRHVISAELEPHPENPWDYRILVTLTDGREWHSAYVIEHAARARLVQIMPA
jgi:hypothetical protein